MKTKNVPRKGFKPSWIILLSFLFLIAHFRVVESSSTPTPTQPPTSTPTAAPSLENSAGPPTITNSPLPTEMVASPTATFTITKVAETLVATPTFTVSIQSTKTPDPPTLVEESPTATPTAIESAPPPKDTPIPTAILEPTSEPKIQRQLLQQDLSEPTSQTENTYPRRGFDPDNFIVRYYDADDLEDEIVPSEMFTEPIDFHLDCSDEVYPFSGCRISDRLFDGNNYSIKWSAELIVPEDGEYTFYLDDVDDGAVLEINQDRVIDKGWNWPDYDDSPTPYTVNLAKGSHDIKVLYEQRIYYTASLQVSWSGPGFSKEVIPVAPTSVVQVLSETNETALPWYEVVFDELTVEAILYQDPAPDSITARVSTFQSEVIEELTLDYYLTKEAGVHFYRGTIDTSKIIQRTGDLMIATIINEDEDFDYNVAVEFLDIMGIPEKSIMGIAKGIGFEGSYPPSSVSFLRAGGFEQASVTLDNFPAAGKDDFYVQNQADVLLYLGHGDHNDNYLHSMQVSDDDFNRIYPANIKGYWNKNLETIIIFGCSVLDINDGNNYHTEDTNPGIEWFNANPDPQTWIGFQALAPDLFLNDGDDLLNNFAERYTEYDDWILSWKLASNEPLVYQDENGEWKRRKFRKYSGAAAIEKDPCTYYFWKEIIVPKYDFEDHVWTYISPITYWKSVPCEKWGKSTSGLELLVASPVEVHVYDAMGRHLGINDQGEYETEIPGSSTELVPISKEGTHQGRVFSIDAADISLGYEVVIVGTGEGTFDLYFEIPDRQAGSVINSGYSSVPVQIGLEYELNLGPGVASDFSLKASNGDVIPSPELLTRDMDLPLNLIIDGVMNTLGWYTSDVMVSLSPSEFSNLIGVQQIEYDLGDGWQVYQQPILFNTNGDYHIKYRAIFEDGSYDATQEVKFKIDKRNTPPIANAGPDQSLTEGTIGYLSGSESLDPDGDLITYSWEVIHTSGAEINIFPSDNPSPSLFTADDGENEIQLTVTDEHSAQDTDLVYITVFNENPEVEAGEDLNAVYGEEVSFEGSFSDPGFLDTHLIHWDFGDGSVASDTLTPTHVYQFGGQYTAVLTVFDDDGGQGSDELIVTVENRPPEIGDIYHSYAQEGKSFDTKVVFSDPDSVSWSASIDYGDGSAEEEIPSLQVGEVPILHTYPDQGEYELRVCVNDAEGNPGCGFFLVYVSNLPPRLSLPDTINGFEGSQLELEPIPFSDPGVHDSHSAEISWGDGSPSEILQLTEQDGSGTVFGTHEYQDDGTYQIEICIADLDEGESCGTFSAVVGNLPPQLSLGPDVQISEGQIYQLQGANFIDPGVLDTHTATVDWNDGTALESLEVVEVDGSWTLHGEHLYRDNGEYPITICVMDNRQDLDCGELTLSVMNVPPEVDAGADQTAAAGAEVIFEGSFQDPGVDDIHEIVWDFGDGSTAEGILTPTHVYENGGQYTVMLTILDDDGGQGSDQLLVTVEKHSPEIGDISLNEAEEGKIFASMVAFNDPDSGSWSATIVYGDGSDAEEIPSLQVGEVPILHTYPDEGEYELRVCVNDAEGNSGCGTFLINVSNLPPQLSLGPDVQISEGQVYKLQSAAFVDPGVLDTHTATVDWGDGTVAEMLEVDGMDVSGSLHGEHLFRDNGEYPITICVMDDRQDQDCGMLTISVMNEPPVVDAGADQTAAPGAEIIFEGSFQDPGLDDTHEIVWNFGDGSTAEGSLTPTHTYQDAGVYITELTITDDDGGVDADQMQITITQPSQNRLVMSDIRSERCMWIDLDTGEYHWFDIDGLEYSGQAKLTQLRFVLLFRSDNPFGKNYIRGVVIRNRYGNAVLITRNGWRRSVYRIIDRNVNDLSVCP